MTSADQSAKPGLRILFITQWFEPEPVFKGVRFARALTDAGHTVRVVTGFPNYPGGAVYPSYRISWRKREIIDGVEVDRLALWPSHDRSPFGRSVNYLSFFLSVLVYCFQHMKRFDVVYVYHPPLTPALAAAIAGKFSGTPFVLDVQDLWPDSVASSGMASGPIVRILNRLCLFVYHRATMIIGQSRGIVALLAERGVPSKKLRLIYNWSNYQPLQSAEGLPLSLNIPPSISTSFEGNFNIVYGGNLGQAQALECLIAGAAEARCADSHVRLHLFGTGVAMEDLAAYARQTAGAVILHGNVSRDLMDRVFERADALALHLKDDPLYRHTIPSKLQHYLSIGQPIIAGIAGEGRALLAQSGAATVFDPMDAAAARDAMIAVSKLSNEAKQTMKKASKTFYIENLSFENAMSETLDVLKTAAEFYEHTIKRQS